MDMVVFCPNTAAQQGREPPDVDYGFWTVHGRGADVAKRAENLRAMNDAAVALFRAGHIPVIGVNMTLPMIEAAGRSEAAYHEFMMPVSLALADRCDACLRVGGLSKGADDEMERFGATGRPIYRSLKEVPPAGG
jgi:hypothetical protein